MMFPMNWLFLSLYMCALTLFPNKKVLSSMNFNESYKDAQCYCFIMKWKW